MLSLLFLNYYNNYDNIKKAAIKMAAFNLKLVIIVHLQ